MVLKNSFNSFCEMIPSIDSDKIFRSMGIPSNFQPFSTKPAYLDIIIEAIDSSGKIFESVNDSRLFCFSIKQLELDSREVFFAQDALYELAANDCAMSLVALWSHLIYNLTSRLIYEYTQLEPMDIFKNGFDRAVPLIPSRPFEKLDSTITNPNEIISQIESRLDKYQTLQLLVMLLYRSIPASMVCDIEKSQDSNLIHQHEIKTIFLAFFSVLDLADMQNDDYLKHLVIRCMIDVAMQNGTLGKMVLEKLVVRISASNASLKSTCNKIFSLLKKASFTNSRCIYGGMETSFQPKNIWTHRDDDIRFQFKIGMHSRI